ncbi:YhcN/YlaJ family sporulation lipoprotein [Metabacillus halosaccharovorans]|uniref:YhcN/YlaJ family sporulation lipoprotein n=1 Tax=Metabacillus halosaccharovorans TaxID=930124 RepID=UPI00203EB8C7|nr:YhcN/YlaJ family sporulation lipoprotein [Metabacillus halosaccharovorans]MCM3441243.1 YhcN/YlaJ family sporulation lipoprotein [Metabacillus halosaccharovorans]
MKFLLTILLILTLAGCTVNQGAPKTDQEKDNGSEPINVKNSVEEHVDRKSGQEISKHLVDLANEIPEVNDATAVVLGPYAVVGIDVNSKLDRNKVETIKYTVAESLMHDPYGARAIVIADADTNVRLREMANDIQEGRPIVGILDELAAIVGRIVPEIPSEILDNQEKQPTNQNNDQLNEKEQQKLEKEQQDQSNNHLNK